MNTPMPADFYASEHDIPTYLRNETDKVDDGAEMLEDLTAIVDIRKTLVMVQQPNHDRFSADEPVLVNYEL